MSISGDIGVVFALNERPQDHAVVKHLLPSSLLCGTARIVFAVKAHVRTYRHVLTAWPLRITYVHLSCAVTRWWFNSRPLHNRGLGTSISVPFIVPFSCERCRPAAFRVSRPLFFDSQSTNPSPAARSTTQRASGSVSGGDKYDSCGGRKSDSRQHDLAAG